MKKVILLLGLILISCSKDTSDPETIVETIIQKPNVRTTITPTQSSNCPLGGYDILVYDDANSNNSKDAGKETFLQNKRKPSYRIRYALRRIETLPHT